MVNIAIVEPLSSKSRFAVVIPENETIENGEVVVVKNGETYTFAICKGGSFASESDALAEEIIFNQKPKRCNISTTEVKVLTTI